MKHFLKSAIFGGALLLGAAPSWAGFTVDQTGKDWIQNGDGTFYPNIEARMRCGDNCPAEPNPHDEELMWFANPGGAESVANASFSSGELIPFSISYDPGTSTYLLNFGGSGIAHQVAEGENQAYCRIGLQLKRGEEDPSSAANIVDLSINGGNQGTFTLDSTDESKLKYVTFNNQTGDQSVNSVTGKLQLSWGGGVNLDGEDVAAGIIFPKYTEGDICQYTPTPTKIPTMDRSGLFGLALGLFVLGWFLLGRRRGLGM